MAVLVEAYLANNRAEKGLNFTVLALAASPERGMQTNLKLVKFTYLFTHMHVLIVQHTVKLLPVALQFRGSNLLI
jgi:hypothetical protein